MHTSPTVFVVAIAGISGAGKTTLVKKVSKQLGDAVALHFDDYQPVATYPKDLARWIEEGKDLDAWEIPQLLDDLRRLRHREAIVLPGGKGPVESARVIVLEEPSGRARFGLRELVDFVVLVELPLEIALARKVNEYLHYCLDNLPQDQLPDALQNLADYYSQYSLHREYYATLVERVREDCDLVLNGTRPADELAYETVAAVKPLTERQQRIK